jgi:hypothetical protein
MCNGLGWLWVRVTIEVRMVSIVGVVSVVRLVGGVVGLVGMVTAPVSWLVTGSDWGAEEEARPC